MEFNYALERRKFEKQWSVLRKQYEDAGMDKESIQQLYKFDLQWLNSERRYIRRQADLPEGVTVEDLSCSDIGYADSSGLLGGGAIGAAPLDRRWWVDEIENEELLRKLATLSDADIELLTVLIFEGKTQSQLAQIRGCSQKSISNHLHKIAKILK